MPKSDKIYLLYDTTDQRYAGSLLGCFTVKHELLKYIYDNGLFWFSVSSYKDGDPDTESLDITADIEALK